MKKIIDAGNMINDGRSAHFIKNHMLKEVQELLDEFIKRDTGLPPGEDGIIGEAVDVALCAIDLAAHEIEDPDKRLEIVNEVVVRKLQKWIDKHG